MIEWLSNLEISILYWINQTTSNFIFDSFFPFYTDLHKSSVFAIPFALFIIYVFIKKFKKLGLLYFLFLIVSIALSDFTGGKIKNYYQRTRPYAEASLNIKQRSPANPKKSFPSNHASNSFGIATYLAVFFPQSRIITFPLASLVAYSRMYNGVHYPSDILAGGILGSLFALLFSRLALFIGLKFYSKQENQKD